MSEMSKFMSKFAAYAGDAENQAIYEYNFEKINAELNDKLYNENLGIYSDYLGYQWQPKLSASGKLLEPLEWRDDGRCGKLYPNSLG